MRLHSLRTATLILAMLTFTVISVQFSVRALATPPPAMSTQSHILVRILELTGTGPDGKIHSLYRNEKGYTTTLDALGRVGSQVSGTGLAEGAYHTLFVRLADKYEILRPDGSRQSGRFSAKGKPTTLRVRGMILVQGDKANAMHMLENPNYYASPRGIREGDDDDD